MEEMGGGGHFDAAATQISNRTVGAVKAELIQLIKEREEKKGNNK
jgi:c-di-AMP phosphodiesterase-like protein